jgi:hypothetical protein
MRRFAGFTPQNVVDRIRDRRDEAETMRHYARLPVKPQGRWHYGFIDWRDWFQAMAVFRGTAYRAGDSGRRRRR